MLVIQDYLMYFYTVVARAIGKNGHLFTYEYHELRSKQATEEFKNHGLDNVRLINN